MHVAGSLQQTDNNDGLFLICRGNGVFCSFGEMRFRNVSLPVLGSSFPLWALNPLDFKALAL